MAFKHLCRQLLRTSHFEKSTNSQHSRQQQVIRSWCLTRRANYAEVFDAQSRGKREVLASNDTINAGLKFQARNLTETARPLCDMGPNKQQGATMLKERMQSPSRIPRYSPSASIETVTWKEVVSSGSMTQEASPSGRCGAVPNSNSVIAQLLDDMISNIASVASQQTKQHVTSSDTDSDSTASLMLTARSAEPRKSAITALKEGIDATCDEISSIAAMETLSGGPHATILSTGLSTQRPRQPSTEPQGMPQPFCTTDFATECMAVDGPADSWLRASAEVTEGSLEVQTSPSCSPASLLLTRQEASWNGYVTTMESKLHASDRHSVEPCLGSSAPVPAAAAPPASASPAAVTCLADGLENSCKKAAPEVCSRQHKAESCLRTPGRQSSVPASRHQQQCQVQQAPLRTAHSSADPACVDGLDVVLNSSCRRAHSSSVNISSSAGTSRRSSLGCDQHKDDGSAAWMTSLRSRSSPIGSCKRALSRRQSSSSAGGQSHSSRGRMLHSNPSAHTATTPAGATAGFSTPPAGVKSSSFTGTAPRSAQSTGGSSSSSMHQRMSLRRSRRESPAQPPSASPSASASRASSAQLPGGARPSLTLTPQGSGASRVVPAVVSRAQSSRSMRSSQDSTPLAAAVGGLVACGAGAVPCTDDLTELLLSEQDIMADPTAVKLFMELNEEIEAEGRAALEAAEAAAAATAARPAPVVEPVLASAAVASQHTRACSAEAAQHAPQKNNEPEAVSEPAGQQQAQVQAQTLHDAAVEGSDHGEVQGSACGRVQDSAAATPPAVVDPTPTTQEDGTQSNTTAGEATEPVLAGSTEQQEHREQPEHQPACGCKCVIM